MIKLQKIFITFIFLLVTILLSSSLAFAVPVPSGNYTGEDIELLIKQNQNGILEFSPQTTINGGFNIDYPITLKGNGNVVIQLSKDSIPVTPWHGVGIAANNVTLDGFQIKGFDNSNNSYEEICVNVSIQPGVEHATVSNNTILVGNNPDEDCFNIDQTMGFTTYYNGNNTDINLIGNTFKAANGTGFRPFFINPGIDGMLVQGNKFYDNFFRDCGIDNDGTIIKGNTFYPSYETANGYSMTLYGTASTINVTVQDNKFLSDYQKTCIRVMNSIATISGNDFHSKLVDGRVYGILICSDCGSNGAVIAYNANDQTFDQLYSDGNNFFYMSASTPEPPIPTPEPSDRNTQYTPNGTLSTIISEIPSTIANETTSTSTKIKVKKTKPPIIKAKDLTICVNDNFKIMKGVKAFENNGNGDDITKYVTTYGKFNTAVPGTYTITYRVKDQYGMTAEEVRTITVKECEKLLEPEKTTNMIPAPPLAPITSPEVPIAPSPECVPVCCPCCGRIVGWILNK